MLKLTFHISPRSWFSPPHHVWRYLQRTKSLKVKDVPLTYLMNLCTVTDKDVTLPHACPIYVQHQQQSCICSGICWLFGCSLWFILFKSFRKRLSMTFGFYMVCFFSQLLSTYEEKKSDWSVGLVSNVGGSHLN